LHQHIILDGGLAKGITIEQDERRTKTTLKHVIQLLEPDTARLQEIGTTSNYSEMLHAAKLLADNKADKNEEWY